MKRDELFAGYEQGQADMLAKCIAAVEGLGLIGPGIPQILAALRDLKEKP